MASAPRSSSETKIHSEQDVFTVVFRAEGLGKQRQLEALDVIKSLLAGTVCRQPGFLCSHVHLSLDGDTIINYQQWESADAFAAFKNGPAREIMPKIAPYGLAPSVYEVAYSQFSAE